MVARLCIVSSLLLIVLCPVKPTRGAEVPDESEEKAADAVTRLGGLVSRDDEAPGRPVVGVSFSPGGKDKEPKARPDRNVHDGLKELAALKRLKTLNLSGNKVTPG